jgi:eukaryotic-like serine/threonine-protein kinase
VDRSDPNGNDERLQEILLDYLESSERGHRPDSAEVLARHPEFAPELKEFLDTHLHLEDLTAPVRRLSQIIVQSTRTGQPASATVGDIPRRLAAITPPRTVGRYEVQGEIGRGGMGIVYKARQAGLNRDVALKLILAGEHASSDALARFRAEAEAVGRLQHPNVVQVYEVGEHNNLPFISLEYCPGGSLDRKLAGKPLPPDQAVELIRTLAEAVQAAHKAGVVHRDLKPANVLLDATGTPKITDFGLAKQLGDSGRTATGAILGTPSYMAPEQADGKGAIVGTAADVYALGAILYECLTGRPPFKAGHLLATVRQVVTEEPAPPRQLNPQIPRKLQTICLKCLEKEPRRRYSSAQALADDLHAYQRGEDIAARPPGIIGRTDRWVRSRPALAATLIAITALYLNHLVLLALGVPNEGGDFHWFATWITLGWGTGAIAFQWLVTRTRWSVPATFGWAALDVLMATLMMARGQGPRSALLVGYPLLIVGTALRFRISLLWFVTCLCVASYLGMVIDAEWRRPELHIGVKDWLIFSLALVILGFLQHQFLRRLRAAMASER